VHCNCIRHTEMLGGGSGSSMVKLVYNGVRICPI